MKKLFTSFSLLAVMLAFPATFANAQNAVTDPSFEAGIGAGTWTETSTNFGTPLCDAACGTCGGPCAANTGSIYAWFGGFGGGVEVGTLAQSVTIPSSASTTELKFAFFIPTASNADADLFAVLMGTDTVFTSSNADSSTYNAGYVNVTVNAEAYEGTTTMLTFYGETQGTAVTNFLLDDVFIGTQSVDLANSVAESMNIFPSPASEMLYVDMSLAGRQDVTVNLTDMTGRTVYSQGMNQVQIGKLAIDVREYPAGTYFLQVLKADGKSLTSKVTIQ